MPQDDAVRWLRGQGLSEEEAQDLVSDAFVALAGSSPRSPRAFLWASLHKLLAQHRRKQKARDKPIERIRDAVHRLDRRPDENLFEKECREGVEDLLMGLPSRLAAVARLLLDEWTVAEIAEGFGIAPSTVRSHVEELRRRLGPLWPSELRAGEGWPDPPEADLPARRI